MANAGSVVVIEIDLKDYMGSFINPSLIPNIEIGPIKTKIRSAILSVFDSNRNFVGLGLAPNYTVVELALAYSTFLLSKGISKIGNQDVAQYITNLALSFMGFPVDSYPSITAIDALTCLPKDEELLNNGELTPNTICYNKIKTTALSKGLGDRITQFWHYAGPSDPEATRGIRYVYNIKYQSDSTHVEFLYSYKEATSLPSSPNGTEQKTIFYIKEESIYYRWNVVNGSGSWVANDSSYYSEMVANPLYYTVSEVTLVSAYLQYYFLLPPGSSNLTYEFLAYFNSAHGFLGGTLVYSGTISRTSSNLANALYGVTTVI